MNAPMLTRRASLVGGVLLVGVGLPGRGAHAAETTDDKPPGSLAQFPLLDSWVRIDAAGITVFTGKAELGQGLRTALMQIAAEELSVPFDAIHLVTADTARTPNEGYTAGSHSMPDSGTAILNAASQVRAILLAIAASSWSLPVDSLTTRDGTVRAPDGRAVRYGDLITDTTLHQNAMVRSALKPPADYTIIGHAQPRVDIPAKVTGGPAYIQDMRPNDMVHARILRPPSYGATLIALDDTEIAKMPGVLKIVRDGSFAGVIAKREWQAVQALRAMVAAARWKPGPKLPERARIYDTLLALPSEDTTILDRLDVADAAVSELSARFNRPYIGHGSIGPSCGLALFDGTNLTVWSHAQGMFPLRAAIAGLTGLPPDKVRCIHVEGSGCYGHNGADDAAGDAALMARAFPGQTVRVQWMREQENTWEPYSPAMVTRVRAGLNGAGNIVDWNYDVWSNTHSNRPGGAGALLAGWSLEKPLTLPRPVPIPQPEGGGDRNAIPLYVLPHATVVHHFIPEMPIRVSAERGLGAYMNIFSIESFMDECAAHTGADPVEYRLRHMQDPRARDVITLAAERFGWSKAAPGSGRGFAFARYKNLGAYCAIALQLAPIGDDGQLRVARAVLAVDSGQIINPDGIRNQIEGGFLQSMSWTLFEQVSWNADGITSRDWAGYPMLRFGLLPDQLETHIIDRPGAPFLGTGEASQGPTPAAIANALFDATHLRLRELPLNPPRLRAAGLA